jgi:hypothetical protein
VVSQNTYYFLTGVVGGWFMITLTRGKKSCVTFQKGKSDIKIKYDLFQKGNAEANALLSSLT